VLGYFNLLFFCTKNLVEFRERISCVIVEKKILYDA
jgi:hypothetical protein